MSAADQYTAGFEAGIAASRDVADMFADQVRQANDRADEAWRLVTDLKADLAEQKYLADVAHQALASALAHQEET